jgi:tRNA G26 N,N-dimethylase Trm1
VLCVKNATQQPGLYTVFYSQSHRTNRTLAVSMARMMEELEITSRVSGIQK